MDWDAGIPHRPVHGQPLVHDGHRCRKSWATAPRFRGPTHPRSVAAGLDGVARSAAALRTDGDRWGPDGAWVGTCRVDDGSEIAAIGMRDLRLPVGGVGVAERRPARLGTRSRARQKSNVSTRPPRWSNPP